MGVTMYPFTMMMILEGTFMGREKMHFIFMVNAPINILNIIAVFWLLNNGGDLFSVIAVQVIAYVLIALIEWFLMLRYVARPPLRISLHETRQLIRATSAFYGIDAVVAIGLTLQFYLISIVTDESQVGLFSSANQLINPITLVLTSFVSSMLPVLTRQVEPGYQRVRVSGERLAEMLFWFSLPCIVGILFVASDLLVFVYGRESFAEAGVFLQILSLSLVSIAFVRVMGILLYATGYENANLRLLIINVVLFILLSLFTIPLLGSLGAAIAVITIGVGDIITHNGAVRQRLRIMFNPVRLLWRAVVASAVMGAVLYVVPTDLHVLVRIGIGAAVYGLTLAVILLVTVGGPGRIRAYYLSRSGGEAGQHTTPPAPLAEGD
jgi:O-antigen/teichoic acid export membrane protein